MNIPVIATTAVSGKILIHQICNMHSYHRLWRYTCNKKIAALKCWDHHEGKKVAWGLYVNLLLFQLYIIWSMIEILVTKPRFKHGTSQAKSLTLGVSQYIDISQYMKNSHPIAIRNSYHNISRFFFLLMKQFIFSFITCLVASASQETFIPL